MLKEILERFPDHNFIKMDGYDNAIIGIAENNDGLHLLYSLQKVYKELSLNLKNEDEDEGDIIDSCHEWYSYNMLPLSTMENGPIFLEDLI